MLTYADVCSHLRPRGSAKTELPLIYLPPGQVLVKVELEEEVVDDAGGIACIR
jgi:hypothetical protein